MKIIQTDNACWLVQPETSTEQVNLQWLIGHLRLLPEQTGGLAALAGKRAGLRDLLGPTVELLEEAEKYTFLMGATRFNKSIQAELARLRAAREGGK